MLGARPLFFGSSSMTGESRDRMNDPEGRFRGDFAVITMIHSCGRGLGRIICGRRRSAGDGVAIFQSNV